MTAETRVCTFLAATSWLVAVVALIDWALGNSTAPAGIVTFALVGAVLTLVAVTLRKQDGR
jgi:hypothetical protein